MKIVIELLKVNVLHHIFFCVIFVRIHFKHVYLSMTMINYSMEKKNLILYVSFESSWSESLK
jgi:hypothetical protein